MKINELYELPMLSSELEEAVVLTTQKTNVSLSFKHGTVRMQIIFHSVLCHLHTTKRLTKRLFGAYDTLVEVEKSDWIKELKKLDPAEMKIFEPKHYAIFFADMGMYQFIASGYEVIVEE